MKVNVKISIAVVALVASTFGFASKSFAQTAVENSSINSNFELNNADKSAPAAAAAVFSRDAEGNINQGAVSASVGLKSAGAAAVSGVLLNEDGVSITNINAAAALGSDKTLNLKVDPQVGTIDFTQTAQP